METVSKQAVGGGQTAEGIGGQAKFHFSGGHEEPLRDLREEI